MTDATLKLVQGKPEYYPHELERRYPRILNKIVELWDSPNIESYFHELMLDTRGGTRQGFPPGIASEIFHLSQLHDQVHQKDEDRAANDPWARVDVRKRHELENLGYRCTPQDFIRAAENQDRPAIILFLSARLPTDVKDERGWTPLMISAFNGNPEIAELLIRSGADVSAKDNAGYGPMHWAAYNGYADVVKLLIIKNADVNARSTHGWTPLLQGAARGHLPACTALLASGAKVNLASNDGWTPLHKACANGHLEVVKLLLARGADPGAAYQTGITPLMLAVKHRRSDIVALLANYALPTNRARLNRPR